MSIQADFDRLALVSEDGTSHNDHYHNYLLRHLPMKCENALEIGCGTGTFARLLAERSEHVLALDLSPEMIRIARERSLPTLPPHECGGSGRGKDQPGPSSPLGQFSNIEFKLADVSNYPLPAESFDCIASIATLHHLPLRDILLKMKAALKPGGVLLILDLFEPAGLSDYLLNFVALLVSVGLRFKHYRRLRRRPEVRAAWAAHEAHDLYPTMRDVHTLCAELLPGAEIRKHLLWRYSIVWQKNLGQ
jgi:SAM-dependent methyltransferase